MERDIEQLFLSTINDLKLSVEQHPDDKSYDLVCKQIEFLYDCITHNKDIESELNGRELNFHIVASRNFSGPDENLLSQVGDISVYLDSIGI